MFILLWTLYGHCEQGNSGYIIKGLMSDTSQLGAGNSSAQSWRGLNITKYEKESLSDTEQMTFFICHLQSPNC